MPTKPSVTTRKTQLGTLILEEKSYNSTVGDGPVERTLYSFTKIYNWRIVQNCPSLVDICARVPHIPGPRLAMSRRSINFEHLAHVPEHIQKRDAATTPDVDHLALEVFTRACCK